MWAISLKIELFAEFPHLLKLLFCWCENKSHYQLFLISRVLLLNTPVTVQSVGPNRPLINSVSLGPRGGSAPATRRQPDRRRARHPAGYRPVPASALDRHPLGNVTHQTTPIYMLLSSNDHETLQFHVLKSAHLPLILGYP